MADARTSVELDIITKSTNTEQVASTLGEITSTLGELSSRGDWSNLAQAAVAAKSLQDVLKGANSSGGSGNGTNTPTDKKRDTDTDIVNAARAISSSISQAIKGDFTGAIAGTMSGAGSFTRSIGKDMTDLNKDSKMGKALGKVGVVMEVLGALGGVVQSVKKIYEDALPHMVEYNRYFERANIEDVARAKHKDVSQVTREEMAEANNRIARNAYEKAYDVVSAYGLNISNNDVLDQIAGLKKYGNIGEDAAFHIVGSTNRAEYSTGADASLMQELIMTERRYSRDTSDTSAFRAIAAAKDTGLSQGQYNEYLQGLQRVIEEGISQGYVKSVDEINANMRMVNALSNGNPLWQGAEGLKRIQEIDKGMAGAVSMQDAGDMLLFKTMQTTIAGMKESDLLAKLNPELYDEDGRPTRADTRYEWNGTPIDTELMLERGLTPEYALNYFKSLDGMYGKDGYSKVKEVKRDLDLNTTGAVELLKLMGEYRGKDMSNKETYDTYQKRIQDVINDPKNKGGEAALADAVGAIGGTLGGIAGNIKGELPTYQNIKNILDEGIKVKLMSMGEAAFKVDLAGLEKTNDWLEKIFGAVTRGDDVFARSGLYDVIQGADGKIQTDLEALQGGLTSPTSNLSELFNSEKTDPATRLAVETLFKTMNKKYDSDQIRKINDSDYMDALSLPGLLARGNAFLNGDDTYRNDVLSGGLAAKMHISDKSKASIVNELLGGWVDDSNTERADIVMNSVLANMSPEERVKLITSESADSALFREKYDQLRAGTSSNLDVYDQFATLLNATGHEELGQELSRRIGYDKLIASLTSGNDIESNSVAQDLAAPKAKNGNVSVLGARLQTYIANGGSYENAKALLGILESGRGRFEDANTNPMMGLDAGYLKTLYEGSDIRAFEEMLERVLKSVTIREENDKAGD